MENLSKALEGKTLEELKPVAPEAAKQNLIEPTEAEVAQIVEALKAGDSHSKIKKEVRRVVKEGEVQKSAQGFSFGQIKEIEMAWKYKIVELTPCEECGKAPCECPPPVEEPVEKPTEEIKAEVTK